MKTYPFNGQEEPIYTVEEAKEHGIEWLDNWREGQPGDWVLTDDGYVARVLKRYGDFIRIVTGSYNPAALRHRMTTELQPSPSRMTPVYGKQRSDSERWMPREPCERFPQG